MRKYKTIIVLFLTTGNRNHNLTTDLQNECFPCFWGHVSHGVEEPEQHGCLLVGSQTWTNKTCSHTLGRVTSMSLSYRRRPPPLLLSWCRRDRSPHRMTGLSLAHLSTLGYVTSKVSTFVLCGVATSPEDGGDENTSKTELFDNQDTNCSKNMLDTSWICVLFSISLLVISFSIS